MPVSWVSFVLSANSRRGLDRPELSAQQPRPENAAFFAHMASYGGPCGKAKALPVPIGRSVNPHGSAHPFDRGKAKKRNRSIGVHHA